jgi:hypothetical protein
MTMMTVTCENPHVTAFPPCLTSFRGCPWWLNLLWETTDRLRLRENDVNLTGRFYCFVLVITCPLSVSVCPSLSV